MCSAHRDTAPSVRMVKKCTITTLQPHPLPALYSFLKVCANDVCFSSRLEVANTVLNVLCWFREAVIFLLSLLVVAKGKLGCIWYNIRKGRENNTQQYLCSSSCLFPVPSLISYFILVAILRLHTYGPQSLSNASKFFGSVPVIWS